jgi:hypothetical protein
MQMLTSNKKLDQSLTWDEICNHEFQPTLKLSIVKKIFLAVFLVLLIRINSYSQTLRDSKHKRTTESFLKVEVDTCSNTSGTIINEYDHHICRRAESPQMPGPVLFYPAGDDIYKWMLAWSRAMKGIQIAY